jgi:hypothetical protein
VASVPEQGNFIPPRIMRRRAAQVVMMPQSVAIIASSRNKLRAQITKNEPVELKQGVFLRSTLLPGHGALSAILRLHVFIALSCASPRFRWRSF